MKQAPGQPRGLFSHPGDGTLLLELLDEPEVALVDGVDVHRRADDVAVLVEAVLGYQDAGDRLLVEHVEDLVLVRVARLLDRASDDVADVVPVDLVAVRVVPVLENRG